MHLNCGDVSVRGGNGLSFIAPQRPLPVCFILSSMHVTACLSSVGQLGCNSLFGMFVSGRESAIAIDKGHSFSLLLWVLTIMTATCTCMCVGCAWTLPCVCRLRRKSSVECHVQSVYRVDTFVVVRFAL